MIIRNCKRRPRLHEIETGGDGISTGGAAPSPAPAVAAAPAAHAPAPVPTSMAEAMWGSSTAAPAAALAAPAPAPAVDPLAAAPAVSGQPRDELGRFTFKNDAGQAVDKDGVPAPDQAAALAAQAAAAAPADDPLNMPDGLGEKAQQRFQALANSNKDLTAKVEHFETQVMPAVQAMQETWTENQVQPEQFQQGMAIIGMMNRGDYAGAQKALLEQLQMLSVLTGQPLSIDPLAGHADLQQQVQQLMMTPEAAAEVARARAMTGMQQQSQQRQQQQADQRRQQQEQEQQAQQQVTKARGDVDAFCKKMAGADLDYAAIEAQLLPIIPELLKDVPPQRWAAMVQQQYQLIKNAVGSMRRSAPAPMQPLRPTGQGGGSPHPKTMFDAMWSGGAAA